MFREPVNYCTNPLDNAGSWDFRSISTLVAAGLRSLRSLLTGVPPDANTASVFSRATHAEVRQPEESEGVRSWPWAFLSRCKSFLSHYHEADIICLLCLSDTYEASDGSHPLQNELPIFSKIMSLQVPYPCRVSKPMGQQRDRAPWSQSMVLMTVWKPNA